jgi:hypothetical protein
MTQVIVEYSVDEYYYAGPAEIEAAWLTPHNAREVLEEVSGQRDYGEVWFSPEPNKTDLEEIMNMAQVRKEKWPKERLQALLLLSYMEWKEYTTYGYRLTPDNALKLRLNLKGEDTMTVSLPDRADELLPLRNWNRMAERFIPPEEDRKLIQEISDTFFSAADGKLEWEIAWALWDNGVFTPNESGKWSMYRAAARLARKLNVLGFGVRKQLCKPLTYEFVGTAAAADNKEAVVKAVKEAIDELLDSNVTEIEIVYWDDEWVCVPKNVAPSDLKVLWDCTYYDLLPLLGNVKPEDATEQQRLQLAETIATELA